MMGLRVEHLGDDRLGEAWPLLRLRYPDLTLDQWLAEARSLHAEGAGAGIVAAQMPNDCIYAVCAYLVEPDAIGHDELVIPFVAYVQWNGTVDPLRHLMQMVETLARQHACVRIRVRGGNLAEGGDTRRWTWLGYEREGAGLTKLVGPHPVGEGVRTAEPLER